MSNLLPNITGFTVLGEEDYSNTYTDADYKNKPEYLKSKRRIEMATKMCKRR